MVSTGFLHKIFENRELRFGYASQWGAHRFGPENGQSTNKYLVFDRESNGQSQEEVDSANPLVPVSETAGVSVLSPWWHCWRRPVWKKKIWIDTTLIWQWLYAQKLFLRINPSGQMVGCRYSIANDSHYRVRIQGRMVKNQKQQVPWGPLLWFVKNTTAFHWSNEFSLPQKACSFILKGFYVFVFRLLKSHINFFSELAKNGPAESSKYPLK